MQPDHRLALSLITLAVFGIAGCGSDDSTPEAGPAPLTVPKAVCSAGDNPETALQGQVPAAMRNSPAGFQGFSCNLRLVGQRPDEGGNWSSATFFDNAQRACAYYSTAVPNANRQNPGVPVIDISDRANPVRTMSLSTPGMIDPWESLRVNHRRKFLIAGNSQSGLGGPEIDIYDLSGDCRAPQLLASVAVGTGTDGSAVTTPVPTRGHEGNIAPDGLTYYVGDRGNQYYNAVDVSNPSKPKLIASWNVRNLGFTGNVIHGVSISEDGTRAYATTAAIPPVGAVADPNAQLNNGFVILDTSEVQARLPNAQIKHVSTSVYKDGGQAQHTIPITKNGKTYVVMVDEAGSAGLGTEANAKAACAVGLAPFPMARIYDVSDEQNPKVVSKIMLETHDPKNCTQVTPDIVGLGTFTYGSHYCSVDNRTNPTALACSYFNSGVRVFDIRDLERPRELAYYNPATAPSRPGSSHVRAGGWVAGGPDWCASRVDFDFERKQIVTMCQDNGLVVLQFGAGTWPFPQSTPSQVHN